MKKGIFISLLLLAVVILAGIFLNSNQIIVQQNNTGTTEELLQSTIQAPDKQPGIPKTVEIPKIGVNADVENVGLDNEGKMDVPKNVYNVGWYELGYRPGEKGSAVLAGHFDGINGEPVVFFNLSSLDPGDLVTITDDKNNKYKFRVYYKQIYPYNRLPLADIFASEVNTNLNLITCDGVFDKLNKNYSQRLVVYSQLLED